MNWSIYFVISKKGKEKKTIQIESVKQKKCLRLYETFCRKKNRSNR